LYRNARGEINEKQAMAPGKSVRGVKSPAPEHIVIPVQ